MGICQISTSNPCVISKKPEPITDGAYYLLSCKSQHRFWHAGQIQHDASSSAHAHSPRWGERHYCEDDIGESPAVCLVAALSVEIVIVMVTIKVLKLLLVSLLALSSQVTGVVRPFRY